MTLTLDKSQKAELKKLVALAQRLADEASEAADHLGEMVTEAESAIEERSETWRQGKAGQAAQERIDNLQAASDAFEEADSALRQVEATLSDL
jgi:hypothetical protein